MGVGCFLTLAISVCKTRGLFGGLWCVFFRWVFPGWGEKVVCVFASVVLGTGDVVVSVFIWS